MFGNACCMEGKKRISTSKKETDEKDKNLKILIGSMKIFGVNLNSKLFEGLTSLHLAVKNKNYEIIETLLVQKEIDVNAGYENNFSSPLLYAIESADKKIIEMLLKHGAKLIPLEDLENIYKREYKDFEKETERLKEQIAARKQWAVCLLNFPGQITTATLISQNNELSERIKNLKNGLEIYKGLLKNMQSTKKFKK